MKIFFSKKIKFAIGIFLLFILTVFFVICPWQGMIPRSIPTEYGAATLVSPKNAPRLFNPNWNSDGTALIVTSEELFPDGGILYAIDLTTGNMKDISDIKDNGFYEGAIWSPDGDYAAFWSSSLGGIGTINTHNLETNFIAKGQFVSWSRNNELAIADVLSGDTTRSAIVTIAPFNGGDQIKIFDSKANYPIFTDIVWSPDGNYIAFGLNLANNLNEDVPTTLFVLDKKGNVKLQITDQSIGSISWTPDSEWVIYFSVVKLSHFSLFKVVDFKGRCMEFQSSIWPMGGPKFSYDGSKIAFSSLESKIYIAETKSIFGEEFWENGGICH